LNNRLVTAVMMLVCISTLVVHYTYMGFHRCNWKLRWRRQFLEFLELFEHQCSWDGIISF